MLIATQPGYDGSTLHIRERPIPGTRQKQTTTIRARPGTFEARYAHAVSGSIELVLYEAGTEFARLCERVGHDGPHSVDWSKVGVSQWRGVSDSRLDALQKFDSVALALGKVSTSRLMHYCVYGRTAREISRIYRKRLQPREMATALGYDLGRAAVCFRLVKRA